MLGFVVPLTIVTLGVTMLRRRRALSVGTPLLSSAADGGMGLASCHLHGAASGRAGRRGGHVVVAAAADGWCARWIPALGISLAWRIDGLAVLMLMITAVGGAVFVYAGGGCFAKPPGAAAAVRAAHAVHGGDDRLRHC